MSKARTVANRKSAKSAVGAGAKQRRPSNATAAKPAAAKNKKPQQAKAAGKAASAESSSPTRVAAKKSATTGKSVPSKKTPAKSAAKITSNSKVKPVSRPATKSIDKPVQSTKKEKPLSAGGKKSKGTEVVLDPGYRPSEDEPFMNERQRIYFRNKLKAWKEDIVRQTRETLAGLHEDSTQHADLADRATSETDRALELRARDRQRKLIAKIDAALARIEDGSYGYCEETGEPIGLKRLDARPIATLSLEAQERHERREKVYRED